MTNILDQRKLNTFEQAGRASMAFVTAKVVEDIVTAIYAAGAGQVTYAVNCQGWQLELRVEPQLQVVVRIGEPKLTGAVRDVLRVHHFVVKTMRAPGGSDKSDDYLVVLI